MLEVSSGSQRKRPPFQRKALDKAALLLIKRVCAEEQTPQDKKYVGFLLTQLLAGAHFTVLFGWLLSKELAHRR